jgi:transcriptional regulator with XRE-family HTH domain
MDVRMQQYGNIYSLTDKEIADDIGKRMRRIRLNDNITRNELQQKSGVHAKTIGDAEDGKNVTMITLISILRGLNSLQLLEDLVKNEEMSPALASMNKGKLRERASGGG